MKDILELIWAGILVVGILIGTAAAFAAFSAFVIIVGVTQQKEFWYLVIIGVFLYAFL
jgi:hypothetical protein